MAVHNYVPTSPLLSRNIRGAIGRWRVLKNTWETSENKKGRNVYIKQELQSLRLEHLALCWLRGLAGDASYRKSGVSICNNKKIKQSALHLPNSNFHHFYFLIHAFGEVTNSRPHYSYKD